MALQGPIPIEFGLMFSHGVFASGSVEPVRDFDASKDGRFLHFHDLRHTGNTMAAGQGASLRELMERMGHSSAR